MEPVPRRSAQQRPEHTAITITAVAIINTASGCVRINIDERSRPAALPRDTGQLVPPWPLQRLPMPDPGVYARQIKLCQL